MEAESYIHFDTAEECDRFVLRLHSALGPSVLGRCCGGKGVCLRTTTFHYVVNNPIQFPVKPPKYTKPTEKRTADTVCCVCLEETKELTPCGHLVCKTCLPFVGLWCPYCKQVL